MRVFLDANVIFSAAKSSGAVRQFLGELKSRGYTLVADGYVVGEAKRNLEAKFPVAMAVFEQVLDGVQVSAKACAPLKPQIAPTLVDKDRPVLAAAIHHHCDILLTGDKTHFGPLYGQTIGGVEILPPASLANKLGDLQ